ncbi:hypothetical protein [Pseudomonas sp. NMI795_08]|uniref:hypothetical protein n=1 Tax=Pseudomonas sp. NMI795_08 TaxID=2903144 RepID=UPI001E5E06DE|nr:hypothetical protein [Pseudomonas sp. NMI795_08]MCE1119123.1 hypothetical protein [Pseudomonas sp. NMI795_08]
MAMRGLDELLKDWSDWTYGGAGLLGGGSTILARWMDSKGDLMFSGSGGSRGTGDEIEQQIEAAVVALAAQDLQAADVLRLEYAAGWWLVCERNGYDFARYDPTEATQLDRARLLGYSWRTYKRRLAKARDHVVQALRDNR